MDSLGNFWRVWKNSRQSGKFWRVWKNSRQSGKFWKSLESFLTVWKVSEQYGEFLDSLESFWTFWKVSKQAGKFQNSLESFQTVWKLLQKACKKPGKYKKNCCHVSHGKYGMNSKAIYALLLHLCHKSYLHTSGAFLSRKRFTLSVWKVLCVIICRAENFEILCLCEGLPLSILILIKFYINFFVNERREEGVAYLSFCSRRRIVNTPFTICASSLPVVVFSSVNI